MKGVIALLAVVAIVDAKLLGSLSMLPSLAFFFGSENNTLYDVNGTTFTKIATVKKNQFFGLKLKGRVRGASYMLPDEAAEDFQTFFFKGRRVFLNNGTHMVQMPVGLKELFENGPVKCDAAFPVVNGSRDVIGTNFILKRSIYECGAVGSICVKSDLADYAQFTNFLSNKKQRVAAALGLSDGVTVLFKQDMYAIIREKSGVAEELESFW